MVVDDGGVMLVLIVYFWAIFVGSIVVCALAKNLNDESERRSSACRSPRSSPRRKAQHTLISTSSSSGVSR